MCSALATRRPFRAPNPAIAAGRSLGVPEKRLTFSYVGGTDLVIGKDRTRTAVQCKHWKTWNVGVRAVREFLGALTDSGIKRGLFITLGGYTGDATQLADQHGIEVVNEAGLATMLEATDARFDPAVLEILHDTRKMCPKREREMVLRTAGRGTGAGTQFWGCSGYPRCRFAMPV